MIEEIQIRDLGVIESATIELAPGLTAITGETGAGKTMVLTGLGLLLGGKADAGAIRPGAQTATVEGRFVPPVGHPSLGIADEAGAIIDEGELIVARTLTPARSRAHLGGRLVPQGLLAEFGSELVTVHGQSEQLRLRSAAHQRRALDEFAGPEQTAILAKYRHLHDQRTRVQAELEQWDNDTQTRQVELERLARALERIDAVGPRAGEEAELRSEGERLGNVEDLRIAAAGAHQIIAGADEPDAPQGILDLIGYAQRFLSSAADYDISLAEWNATLATVSNQLSDVHTEMGSYLASLAADPERLQDVHARRAALNELTRAYTSTGELADLLAFAEQARERVADLTAPGGGREAIADRLTQLTSEEREAAAAISHGRRQAAKQMATAVDAELAGLAMPGANTHIDLLDRPELGPFGAEDVEFGLTTHPGAPVRPLAKGASGGELSRVMLALEVAMARQQATVQDTFPTFVFDEVDAGVGGAAAVEVGRRLAELARHTQVIVVTHLAQVAAFADQHLVVLKTSDPSAGVTNSDIRTVAGSDREAELARMLSGDPSSTHALRHAAELLERPVVEE